LVSERDEYSGGAPETEHHADPAEKAKELLEGAAHGVAHPVETAKELEHEAEVGESARTPLIVLSGVTIGVGIVVVLLLALSLTLYFVYGGR
jgi:ABC-type nickel/cobalt efflux system permease component RcnA